MVDIYSYVINKWREEKGAAEGCLPIYIQCVLSFFPYCRKWDAATFEAATHAMRLQDEEYYRRLLDFCPLGWLPADNERAIRVLHQYELEGTPLSAANFDMWYQAVGFRTASFSNFEDIHDYNFTEVFRRFLIEFEEQRKNLVSCSTLPKSWKEN